MIENESIHWMVMQVPSRGYRQRRLWAAGTLNLAAVLVVGVLLVTPATAHSPWYSRLVWVLLGVVNLFAWQAHWRTTWRCWRRGGHELAYYLKPGVHEGVPLDWVPADREVDHVIGKTAHWLGSESLTQTVRGIAEENGFAIEAVCCATCRAVDRRGDLVAQRILAGEPPLPRARW